jgi:hypothetical protein
MSIVHMKKEPSLRSHLCAHPCTSIFAPIIAQSSLRSYPLLSPLYCTVNQRCIPSLSFILLSFTHFWCNFSFILTFTPPFALLVFTVPTCYLANEMSRRRTIESDDDGEIVDVSFKRSLDINMSLLRTIMSIT